MSFIDHLKKKKQKKQTNQVGVVSKIKIKYWIRLFISNSIFVILFFCLKLIDYD